MKDPTTGYTIEPTDELMAAQAFSFHCWRRIFGNRYVFTLYELARHPEIQNKLHEEVDEVFKRCDDNPTYEAVMEMSYLDMVLDESMGVYPAIDNLVRRCTKDGGVLPAGQIRVEKGTVIHIPVYALQHDPKYYPEPEKFIPERFSEGKKEH
ncbi:Cytochrome P450 3A8 [Eumeta japonica]|uniref:unspecific monooxygenase n=1 Tax=Eumeta variegata TaxID=151549 RepID=A0A4C2A5U5_EUMVA|nr:Cytochrome P450 3A8 [Eumeta japonica]